MTVGKPNQLTQLTATALKTKLRIDSLWLIEREFALSSRR
jgi:hypothetical protein